VENFPDEIPWLSLADPQEIIPTGGKRLQESPSSQNWGKFSRFDISVDNPPAIFSRGRLHRLPLIAFGLRFRLRLLLEIAGDFEAVVSNRRKSWGDFTIASAAGNGCHDGPPPFLAGPAFYAPRENLVGKVRRASLASR
jgi:hypothetical protein